MLSIQSVLPIFIIQGESYVLARWFKCHLWPKFSMWVKFYDLFILIWFLRVYFVKKVFQWDLHSLRKMTTSYKILDVKKATLALYHKGLPCLQIGSKKVLLNLHSLCLNLYLILKLIHEMQVILHLFCSNTLLMPLRQICEITLVLLLT